MAWYEIAVYLLGSGGIIGGVWKIVTMKVEKEGLVIENLKQIIEEVKKNHKDYKIETDEKINKIENKITELTTVNEIQMTAINQGYRCSSVPQGSECPVIKNFENNKSKKHGTV